MGEAGAEAILPLSRGADGKLGVQSTGSRPVVVNMTISTSDAASFRRSTKQIMNEVKSAAGRM
jgi:phage-related minor tail protein